MTLLQEIVLGVVQGLTEFLPISSTAHLRVVPAFFGWEDPGAAFTAVVQLGTMAAVLVFFRRDLAQIALGFLRGLRRPGHRGTLEYRMGWYLVLATIPIALAGFGFRRQIETGARSLYLIGAALIVFGLVMVAAERVATQRRGTADVTATDALGVGLAQALALIPGVSRSGATISAGLVLGLDRAAAARFSFLLSVPAVVLSGLFEARKFVADPAGTDVGGVVVAAVAAFVFGYASIAFLLRFLAHHSIAWFSAYRVVLGALVLALAATGAIS
jgi:undecaprenyl-diphosphatase